MKPPNRTLEIPYDKISKLSIRNDPLVDSEQKIGTGAKFAKPFTFGVFGAADRSKALKPRPFGGCLTDRAKLFSLTPKSHLLSIFESGGYMILRLAVLALSLSFAAQVSAAPKKLTSPLTEDWSKWSVPMLDEQDTAVLAKDVAAPAGSPRKIASAQEFQEKDLKPDVVAFRKAYLSVKTPDQLEALFVKAESEWKSYSPDLKYFTANLLVARTLRGIVWRLRPLFETGSLFSGNRATHGATVSMIRQLASGIDIYFPTDQWEAGFDYFTQPSTSMTSSDQFKNVREFQKFLAKDFVPAMQTAARRTAEVLAANPNPVFVWDRKIVYGTATFADNARRFVGFGPAEIYFSNAMLYRGMHDATVFTAYNQDDLLNIAGRLGKRFGIESALQSSEMGMTDQQRNKIVMESVQKFRFLELQNYGEEKYGTNAMKSALTYLQLSVSLQKKGYDYLNRAGATDAYVFNPLDFQPQSAPKLERAVNNLVAAVAGPTEVRDPVSGDVVKINLPEFYNKPYSNLSVLMAKGFNRRKASEATLTNTKGETLTYRNYMYDSSQKWDNGAWAKFVPSAQGQNDEYMKNAKRIVNYSLGTPLVAGQVGLFVR